MSPLLAVYCIYICVTNIINYTIRTRKMKLNVRCNNCFRIYFAYVDVMQ